MTDPRQRRFSPEVRERAVCLVRQHQGEHTSQWAAISSIAAKIGCTAETLRGWLADVLARIADHPVSRLTELLPWNWKTTLAQQAAAA